MAEDTVARLVEEPGPDERDLKKEPAADQYDDLDPKTLFSQLKDWFDDDSEHLRDWREEAREDYAFRALDQWSDEDRTYLERQKRPVITFDRINPIIRTVVGQEVSNRQEARYIAREQGDLQVNELLTEAARWFRDRANADGHDTDAFDDCLTCGVGCSEIRLDYEENPDGEPRMPRVDVLQMLWDSSCEQTNLTDARRIWRVKDVPLTEAQHLFPDASKSELDAAWARDDAEKADRTGPHRAGPPYYEAKFPEDDDSIDDWDSKVTLVECQWWDRETFYRLTDPMTGSEMTLSEADYLTLVERLNQMRIGLPMQGVKQTKKVYRRAFLGSEVLSVSKTPCPDHFSYNFITGFRDRNTGTWYGLVKAMKDPQRWANKWLSQTLHILNSQAAGGLMVEEGAILDERQFEQEWAKPNSITKFRKGTLASGAVVPKPPPQLPTGYINLIEFAASATREATGVNLEQMGMREAVQPGVLEYQRRQSGIQLLAGIFDNLRRYRYRQADQMLYIIQNYLSDGRLIRIGGEQSGQYVPLLRNQTLGEYDVIVDDAPTAPNQKEQVWQVFSALLPTVGGMMTAEMWATMLDYSPLPTAVAEALKQAMAPPPPTPEEEMAKQLELQAGQATVQGIAAEAAKDQAQVVNYNAQAREHMAKAAKLTRETLQPQLFRPPPAQFGPRPGIRTPPRPRMPMGPRPMPMNGGWRQ